MLNDSITTWYVYGLIDPTTDELRYVGKTFDLSKRLRRHYSDARIRPRTHVNHWIASLFRDNLHPRCIIIESRHSAYSNAALAEIDWIRILRQDCRLTNRTDGGDGCLGVVRAPISEETRRRLSVSHIGYKQSHEHIAKRAAKLRGVPLKPNPNRTWTIERRQLMSAMKKRQVISQEHRQKISKANLGRKRSPEVIEKTAKALRGRKRSPEAIFKAAQALKGRTFSDIHRARLKAKAIEREAYRKKQREAYAIGANAT